MDKAKDRVKQKKVGGTKAAIVHGVIYFFLVLLCVLYLLPLLWILITSVKEKAELIATPFALPTAIHWENYTFAWKNAFLGKAMLNSLVVCVITLALSLILGSMAAFAIARMRWKLQNVTLTYFLIGMMVPVHVVMIPLYIAFSKIHMVDSIWGLILPYVTFSLPTTVYLMTGFFKGLPAELFESACIDGCSVYRIFTQIAVPLARTGLFVAGLMTFVANWNELLISMVFIQTDSKKTLPAALAKFAGPHSTSYTREMAAIVIAVVPTIIVYCAFSNQIVDGLTAGAVKG